MPVIPSGGIFSNSIVTLPVLSGLTKRFFFNLVNQCHPFFLIALRFFMLRFFMILYAGVPGIKQDKFGGKTTFFCLVQHIKEVAIFCFSFSVFTLNSKVNRDYNIIICPDNRFKIDAIYNLMMFATPLPVNKIMCLE